MYSINGSAQTTAKITKERKVEGNGYIWYKLKKGGMYGAQDIEGNIIVPIKYNSVDEYMGYKDVHFFKVTDGDFVGAYTPNGNYVVPIEGHYTSVHLYHEFGKTYWVVKKNGGATGVLDSKGNVVIPPHELYTDFRFGCGNDGVYYISSRRGNVGSGLEGLYDLNGSEIIPADKYTFVFYNDGKPYAIQGYGENEKRVELSGLTIPQTSRFDYSLYGGIYSSGRTPSSSKKTTESASSSNSPANNSGHNNNSGNGTTTVVVEHHHDPVPVQQWQACFACGGMGTMGCDNCGGGGTKYIGDRLHRCSRCNGRGIIPCNVCYGNKGQYVTVYQ